MNAIQNLAPKLIGSAETELMGFAFKTLGIEGVTLQIIQNDKVLDMFSTEDISLSALLTKTQLGTYQLMLRSKPDNILTFILAHEMIHLSQMVNGKLSLDMGRRVFSWNGQEYATSYPYDNRPWEIEAKNKGEKLWKQWKRERKK